MERMLCPLLLEAAETSATTSGRGVLYVQLLQGLLLAVPARLSRGNSLQTNLRLFAMSCCCSML